SQAVIPRQDAIEQRRLSRSKKAGQDRYGNRFAIVFYASHSLWFPLEMVVAQKRTGSNPDPFPSTLPPRSAAKRSGPLFLEFTQINIHHLRQLDEIDLLRVGELGELFAPDVRRIVLPRINLKVARPLLLLLFAWHLGLRDDANARSEWQRIAEQESGVRKGLARESWQRGLTVPDRVLGHVDDHYVRRAIQKKTVPMGANAGADLVEIVIVELEVGKHRAARVDLLKEVARCVRNRMVDVYRVVVEDFRQSVLVLVDAGQIRLRLGDKDIDALGVFGCQFVGPAVTGPHERKAIPVQTISRGAILGVRAPPVADCDAVLLVADAVLVLPVELVDLDLVSVPDRAGIESFQVPFEHLLHAGDHGLGAELRRASRRPGDPQRH